ncbi:DUF3558 domain-containing protein [Catenulispora rubra]|uniref:DUF3558 domain-containing protein n=1 Tax=Catenulispora rubra TaxID=280293 RepID=UPI001892539F|nr:DUF3558 domain-containing protein [Catenulispora rubra]
MTDQYGLDRSGGQKKKRRLWLKVGLPSLLVVVLAGGTVFLYGAAGGFRSAHQKDVGSGSVTDPLQYGVDIAAGDTKQYPTDVPGYTPAATPDPGRLAGVDPRQFYFAMLKRQGMVKITELTHVGYNGTQAYASQWPYGNASHSVVDWSTRKHILETESVFAPRDGDKDGLHHDLLIRCTDSDQDAIYDPADPVFGIKASWRTEADKGHRCSRRMQPTWDVENVGTSDGVMPGGLTSDEVDKYLSYIDHIPGLIEVKRPTVATGTDGKQYILLDANIVPQDAGVKDPDRHGVSFLEAGFAQTGHKPTDYPLIVSAGLAQGRHFLYYVDPQTLLPAYSVALDTKVVKLDGTVDADNAQSAFRELYEYAYPQRLDPARTQSGGPSTIDFKLPPFARPDIPDNTAAPATPSGSTPGGQPDSHSAPRVPAALKTATLLQDPCKLVPDGQAGQLGTKPGVTSDDTANPGCVLISTFSSNNKISFNAVPADTSGLSAVYDQKLNAAYFEPLTIDGYPALHAGNEDKREYGQCTSYVGVTDQLYFKVNADILDGPNSHSPCAIADRFATAIVQNMVKGG